MSVALGFGAAVSHLMIYVLSVPSDYNMGLEAGGRFAVGFLFLLITPVTWSLSSWSGLLAASEFRGRSVRSWGVMLVPVLVGTALGWIIVTNWWFIWAEFPELLDPAVASADVQWNVVGWHAAWIAGPFIVVFVGAIISPAVSSVWRARHRSDG